MDEKEIVRVLLVDDDEDDYVLTRDLFAEIEGGRYTLDWVDSYEDGHKAICRGEHDVYLVDYRLGAHTGLELLREVLAEGCRAPIILLTGQGDREVDIEAMRRGAADYLIKMQTGAPLLERSIRYAIERKKTEGGIIAAEQRFRAVFEQSADAVLLIDLATRRIIDTNVAFRKLLGFTQEELLHMTMYDFISGSREQIDEYIREVTERHYVFVDECGFVTNTDSVLQVEASLNFISYGDSRAISIMARDLSQRKVRSSDSQTAGEEKLVYDLLNGITNEFRTPLTSVMGMTSLLERELATPEKQAYARMLGNSVSGLISILGHVSTIMRCRELPQDGFEQFPMVRTLREIAVGFEKTARAKNVGLQINIRNDALIRVDRTLFSRAVGALLDNAVHFTNRGVISVTADAQMVDGRYQAFLQISDTGSGIAADLLPRVFEPFVRQFHEKGAQQEGRGLGLTIAKNVVEAFGGTIKLISVEGEGTTALCTLPAEPVSQPYNGGRQQETVERYTGLPQMLVIEDDKGYQKLIMRHFDGIYRIDCADTAEQAISLCENGSYSLILVDINLGYGRSGIDALMAIRRLPDYQDIPAIAVTAYSFELKRKELFEAGFTDYIQKPFTQSQILGVVSRHIAASRRISPLPLA